MTNEKKVIVTEHLAEDGYRSFRVKSIDKEGREFPIKFFGYKEDEECKDESDRKVWDKATAFAQAVEVARNYKHQEPYEKILLTFS
jgi:hypothetical protein